MFAAIGAIAMIQEGNEIIRTNNVQDPSVDVGERVSRSLAARYDLVTDNTFEISETDDVDELAIRHDDNQIILFAQTRGWNFMYFPTDWDNYRVNVNMALSLIDTNTRSVLASGDCIYSPEYDDSDQAPTHDYLLSDNAAGLKAELKKSADYCTQKFLSETFS
jgi:hypothetical protein